jgi:hypothetical protein
MHTSEYFVGEPEWKKSRSKRARILENDIKMVFK